MDVGGGNRGRVEVGRREEAEGGKQKAKGHFDLVAFEPTLFADNRKLMDCGKIIVPAPQPY